MFASVFFFFFFFLFVWVGGGFGFFFFLLCGGGVGGGGGLGVLVLPPSPAVDCSNPHSPLLPPLHHPLSKNWNQRFFHKFKDLHNSVNN